VRNEVVPTTPTFLDAFAKYGSAQLAVIRRASKERRLSGKFHQASRAPGPSRRPAIGEALAARLAKEAPSQTILRHDKGLICSASLNAAGPHGPTVPPVPPSDRGRSSPPIVALPWIRRGVIGRQRRRRRSVPSPVNRGNRLDDFVWLDLGALRCNR
jgi:hypothetical protein